VDQQYRHTLRRAILCVGEPATVREPMDASGHDDIPS